MVRDSYLKPVIETNWVKASRYEETLPTILGPKSSVVHPLNLLWAITCR